MIYLPESLVVQGVICSSQGSDSELENHPFEVWNWWHNRLYGVDGESHRTTIIPVFHGEKKCWRFDIVHDISMLIPVHDSNELLNTG